MFFKTEISKKYLTNILKPEISLNNTAPTSQKTYYFFVIKTGRLMLPILRIIWNTDKLWVLHAEFVMLKQLV
jgi:hypothetical protein